MKAFKHMSNDGIVKTGDLPNKAGLPSEQAQQAAERQERPKSLDNLFRQVRRVQEKTGDPMRRIEAIESLGLVPNKVSSTPPDTITVRPSELWIDGSYQRNMTRSSLALILRIVENWSWAKFKPPVVCRDAQGRMVVIDGQHTAIAAATHPYIDKIPALFVPIESVESAAMAFISHNTDKVNVTALDKFQARLTAKDPVALGIKDGIDKYDIALMRWVPTSGSGDIRPNQTMASSELETQYKRLGRAKFFELLSALSQCQFRPLRREHLMAFSILMFGDPKGSGEPAEKISTEMLVEVVKSLSDSDSLMAAAHISQATSQTKGKALAIHYRNRYREHFQFDR